MWASSEPCTRSSASAAGEPSAALGVDRRVVQIEMVIEGGLVRLGQLFPMQLDLGRGADLLLRHRDLQIVGTDLDSAKWHEGQVTADDAFLDRAELRLVGL